MLFELYTSIVSPTAVVVDVGEKDIHQTKLNNSDRYERFGGERLVHIK